MTTPVAVHQYATQNHRIERFVFANATDRAAGTPNGVTNPDGSSYTIALADVGQIAYQSDTSAYYRLTGVGPLAWLQVTGTAATGSAGGDLTGTYPNPTLVAAGPGATGPIGDGTHVPVVTIDTKGRVTALSSAAITGAPPSGTAGGDLSGTYPNPAVAKIQGRSVAASAPTDGQVLEWVAANSDWEPASLPTSLPPSGTAGGDLTGTYPNPTIGALSVTAAKIAAGTITDAQVAAANKDGVAATASLRTLGTGAAQACAGNDSRLSDARTPTAHESSHEAGGSDALPWSASIHGAGTHAARPAAASTNAGYLYFETDTGNLFRCDGAAWTQIATTSAGFSSPMTTAGDLIVGGTSGAPTRLAVGSNGQHLKVESGTESWQDDTLSIGCGFDGGGSALVVGSAADIRIPYACTIVECTLLADVSGSVTVDIYKAALGSYPPVVGGSIVAADKPTITTATNSTDTTLTGWTTSISAGDCLRFHVDSATTITRLSLILKVKRS